MMRAVNTRGLVLVGCGFMGRALLEGWIANGLEPRAVFVQDPTPSDWLRTQPGLRLNEPLPQTPAAVVIATKPQILGSVLPSLAGLGGGATLVVSIAAGAPVSYFEAHFGSRTPIVRAMPNLPASVGVGVTALFGNKAVGVAEMGLANSLFNSVGTVVTLPDESMLHVVTGLSGSGPAYVFALAEAMTAAGADLGLPPALARVLAVRTVAGAGRMLADPNADPTELRVAVTSKGGTTEAGLGALMVDPGGIAQLVRRTVDIARQRSIELSEGQ